MAPSLRARLRLAERYAELGLGRCARSVLERSRADAADAGDAEELEVLEALCRILLTGTDGRSAREAAAELVRRGSGPRARLLLGEAQLAAGERDAARFSFATVFEAAAAGPAERARALIGRARIAIAEEDEGGAGAAAMTAVGELATWAVGADVGAAEVSAIIPLLERAVALAVAAGRAADVAELVDGADAEKLPVGYLRAVALGARQSSGAGEVSDADIETALAAECAARPQLLPARLRLIELRLRRRHRDRAALENAIADLEALDAELDDSDDPGSATYRAAVQLLLATAYEDEPGELGRAESAYRRGLELRPGQVSAATRLAALAGSRGDRAGALDAAALALTIDSASHLGWLAAARLCGVPGPDDEVAVGRLLAAAEPGAEIAAPAARRLVAAAAEVARSELLAGMHARGHRMKNLLGIVGSRARKARKLVRRLVGDGQLTDALIELERDLTSLYEEWAQYLRSIGGAGATMESVSLAPLLREVAAAARDSGHVGVGLELAERLPDLRGDRVLLREALLNLAVNGVEACAAGGGSVALSARVRAAGSAPVVEIAVRDTGPGIPRAELARVTAPGFTTKESGSGLGLAVAERVISAHRGRLLIDSEEGRGTAIIVLLPTELAGVGYSSIERTP